MKIQQSYNVLENEFITLSDGVHLSAKIWLPDVSIIEPVPAVLEFLPYGKRYYTHQRDESNYQMFAAAGIAGVRVDIRGYGESEGVTDGEYTKQEINDACEVIDWIIKQKWCNGSVGMMGICWGGHNSLQVAAVHPPALKAIIAVCSIPDRHNDYIHYKNGCHLHTSLYWSNNMLTYQGRAPDPALVGDQWREMRMQRLKNAQSFIEDWLSHPQRDDYWKSAQLSDVKVPVLIVSGWADGNRNMALHAAEELNDQSKIVIGPWIHKYPQMAYPRWEFREEAIRWWNRWLRNDHNNIEDLPRLRAFIIDSPLPKAEKLVDPGNWIAKKEWKLPQMEEFYISAMGTLESGCSSPSYDQNLYVKTSHDLGTTSGDYFTLNTDAMPGDQQFDDALSICFDSKPLETAKEYLGHPELEAYVSCSEETSHLVVRLLDVHPDGVSTRVSFGFINLAHREENSPPKPMSIGEKVRIKVVMDSCGYRFRVGHKIRIALSTTYWPYIFPSVANPGVCVDQANVRLKLPLLGNFEDIMMPEPKSVLESIGNQKQDLSTFYEDVPKPLVTKDIDEARINSKSATKIERYIKRDLITRRTYYHVHEDYGLKQVPSTDGLYIHSTRDEKWSIIPDQPLTCEGLVTCSVRMLRSDDRFGVFHTTTIAKSELKATKENWLVKANLKAFDGETQIFEKDFEKAIRRAFM